MTERELEDSSQPRKRIAVACGRCRKRKIRCSGDPGNGGPCSNCKNAGHEPCLFLRVSSTETQLRDGSGSDFGYNVDTARAYQTRATLPAHNAVSQYATDMSAGDIMAGYRQNTYPYGGKGYYSAVTGWGGTYPDDGVDYGLNYSSYPHLNQDPVHMVHGYRYGSGAKAPIYVDADASTYSYGNLVHRPAASSDLPNFSLSSMAASLPSSSDRHPGVNRTLTSSSAYRADNLPGHYSTSKASTSHSADAGYSSLNAPFESPVSFAASAALPSGVSTRSASHSEVAPYPSGSSGSGDGLYGSEQSPYRSIHESDSYIYDRLDGSRRDSHSSGGASSASVLSNGQVYVPESHHHHTSAQGYVAVAAAASSSQTGVAEGATTATGTGSGGSGTSRAHASGHQRSAGSLRSA